MTKKLVTIAVTFNLIFLKFQQDSIRAPKESMIGMIWYL